MLRVYTLGPFRVWRDDAELPETAWQREKARQLFQLLLTERWRFLQKEQIIDALWPDLDPAQGDRNFKVALNALQHALEPDRLPRATPTYVQRRNETYGLNREAPLWVDTEAFEQAIAQAERAETNYPATAIAHYRAAVDLYTGDYLPEALYEDWATAERERLLVLYLSAAARLAELLVEAGQYQEPIRLCQAILAKDPLWEEAYRLLMRCYHARGNRPLVLRTYEQCVTRLREELGVSPLPQTTQLYLEMTKSQ